MNVVGRVARAYGISRIRNPVEDLRDSWRTTRSDGPARLLDLAAACAVRSVGFQFRALSRRYGLLSPDHFLGLAATGRLNAAALARLMDTLPEGCTEIMLHPGIWDRELEKVGSRLQRQRETEMEALLAPEVGRVVKQRNIQLITYYELN